MTYREDHISNGRRFVDKFEKLVLFMRDAGCWAEWNEDLGVWRLDEFEVFEWGKTVVEDIYADGIVLLRQAELETDPAQQELLTQRGRALMQWGKISAGAGHLTGTLKHAGSDPRVACSMAEMDPGRALLNSLSGVIDLATGGDLGKNPEFRCTKRCGAEFKGTAWQGGLWENFLKFVVPDEGLRRYLQLIVGYAAVAGVDERLICFLLGPPGTGKSIFVTAVEAALGEYSISMATDQFLVNAKDTYGLAQLPGARLIVASEFDENQKINVALIKRITGGDTVTVRMIRGKPFAYSPVGTLLIPTNHIPFFGSDAAAWARLVIVPFEQVLVPESFGSVDLKEQFRDPGVASSVLGWIVEGAQRWLDGERVWGSMPQLVADIVGEAREDQRHPIEEFVVDCWDWEKYTPEYKDAPTDFNSSEQIHMALVFWMAQQGYKDVPPIKRMGRWLRQSGLEPRRNASKRGWGPGGVREGALMFGGL